MKTSYLRSSFLALSLASPILAQDADVKHFWDFEDSSVEGFTRNFADKVGNSAGTASTTGSTDSGEVYPGGAVAVGTGHAGGDSAPTFGIYRTLVDDPDSNHLNIDGSEIYQPGTQPFSISLWVNLEDDDPLGTEPWADKVAGILDWSGDGGDGPQALYLRSTGIFRYRVDAGSDFILVDAPVPRDGGWHFVVLTYDPSGQAILHVDGAGSDNEAPVSGIAEGDVPIDPAPYIGAFNLKSTTVGNSVRNGLTGSIDDVAVFSGVLSDTEIDGLFDGSLSPADIVFVPEPSAPIGHYWDLDTLNDELLPQDLFGEFDLADAPGGFANFEVDPVYGSAFEGAEASLNMEKASEDFLVSDTWDETNSQPKALDFGLSSFAFSYWVWDSSNSDTGDDDPLTACVFDALDGTETGLQMSTTAEGYLNLRIDDNEGNTSISSLISGFETLKMPADRWVQVSVNVDRDSKMLTIHFDGVSQGSYDISNLTGRIFGTQDLQIGVINGGGQDTQAQKCGIDELAFYPRTLEGEEITGLAAATTTPLVVLNTIPAGPATIVSYSVDSSTKESTLIWESIIDTTYSVWGSGELETWTELSADGGIAGTGSNLTFSHTPAGPPEKYFYQVRSN